MNKIYFFTFFENRSRYQRTTTSEIDRVSSYRQRIWLYSLLFTLGMVGQYNIASSQTGNAIYLNGANDYVNLGTSTAFNTGGFSSNMTLETWVKPNVITSSINSLIMKESSTTANWGLRLYSGVLNFYLINSSGTAANIDVSSSLVPLNQWTHIAATYDAAASQIKLYVNGQLQGTATQTGTMRLTTTVPVSLGATPGLGRYFKGGMDEVRIWNVTRTQAEIANNMSNTLIGTETGLLAYYNMDNIPAAGQAKTVADIGTLQGAQNGTTVGTATTPTSGLAIPCSDIETAEPKSTPTSVNIRGLSNFATIGTPYTSGTGVYNLTGNLGSISACGGDFYDSGGAGGNYSNNENRTVTFCSGNGIDKVRLVFSAFNLETNYDKLFIYDGASTSASLLGTYTGTASPGTIVSSGTCLTVRFTSDGSGTPAGWAATISCAPSVLSSHEWKVVASGAGSSATALASGTMTSPSFAATGLTPANNYDLYTKISTMSCWPNANATFTTQRAWENALHFDGVDDYVDCGMGIPTVSNTFTLEAWVNPSAGYGLFSDQTNPVEFISRFGAGGAGNAAYRLGINLGGAAQFGVYNGTTNAAVISTTAIPTNTWTHIAGVRTANNTLQIYINGVLNATLSSTILPQASNYPVVLGKPVAGNNRYSGMLDEVRIWNSERTATQIQTGMWATIPSGTPNLLAYYTFNQNTANNTNTGLTSLTDVSGNNVTGTLTNFALTGNTSNWIAHSPILSTPTSANVVGTNATLGATIGEVGTSAITERGILWATTNNPTFTTAGVNRVVASGTATGAYTANVTGLVSGATIYYVGYALTNDGIGYSPTGSFVTINPCPPITAAPTIPNIGLMDATISWTSTAAAVDYTWKVVASGAGSNGTAIATGTTASLTANVTGLSVATPYEVYITVNCSGATTSTWSSVGTFTTLSCSPLSAAPTISNITGTTATINWTSVATATDYTWKVVAAGAGANGTAIATGTTANLTADATALTMGTSYEVYVKVNCAGPSNSGWSAVATFSTVCAVPTNVAVSNINTTSATLSWTTAGVANYAWKVVASGAGSNATAITSGTVTNTSVNLIGLGINTTYDCYVQTVCGAGTSAWTNVVSFTTLCDVPNNLTASNITYMTATLTWNPASTADYSWKVVASGAGPNATAIASGNATTTTAPVMGLSGGMSYDAYIRTNCGAGISAWSSPLTFSTLACNATPNNLTALNVTYTTADFTWDPIPNISSYNWKVVASGAGISATAIASGTTTTGLTVSNLSAGTNYDFYIQTTCGTNSASAWSNPYTFSTNACTAPINLVATNVSYTDVIINWAALSGVIGYTWKVVAAGAGVNGTPLFTGTSVSAPDTITGLTSATAYEVYLQTNCAAGLNSAWSSALSFTTANCAAPTGLVTSNIGFDGLSLSWSPQSNVYYYTYKIVAAGAGVNGVAIATGSSATTGALISGLSASSSYDAYVRVNCTAAFTSVWSLPVTFTTLNCNKPLTIVASNESFTEATLRWSTIANAQGYACRLVAAGAGPNATAIFTDTVTLDSVRITGLTAGTSYDFYVQTRCNGTTFSDFSVVKTFTTQSCIIPSALAVANILPGSATLTWSSVNFAAKYYWKIVPKGAGVNATAIATDSVTSSSASISGLSGLTAYDAYVRLNCGVNNTSAWSSPISFSTPLLPNNAPWTLGTAGWFNGVNDYLTLGSGLTNPNDFTIEFWVKADNNQPDTLQTWYGTTDRYITLVERSTSSQTPYAIRYSPLTGVIKVFRTDGANAPIQITGNASIKDGSYHHIALTRDNLSHELKLYVDGVLDGSEVDLTNTINPTGAQTIVAARTVSGGNILHFKGNIDELRFWDVARQVSDIQNAKDAPLTGTEVGLLAYYNMENVISGNAQTVPSVTIPAISTRNATTTGTATTPIFSHPCMIFDTKDVGIATTPTTIQLKFATHDLFSIGFDWKLTTLGAGINNLGLFSGTTVDTISIIGLDPSTTYDLYTKSPCTNTWVGPIQVITQNTWRNALAFDGVDDHVNLGNGSSFGSITANATVEAWVRPSNITGSGYIFNKETAATGGISLYLDAGVPTFAVKSSTWASVAGTDALPLNEWTHIAGVYNGSQLLLYVNGRAIATSPQTTAIPAITGNAFIGKQYSNSNYFSGMIDELRVWNTARSTQQIQNNLYAFPASNSTGLVAYYGLNEGTSNASNTGILTSVDATSNANNGTLSGFALSGNTSNWVAHSPLLSSPITGVLIGNNVTVYDSVMQSGTAPIIERGFIWSITNTNANNLILGSAGTNKVPVTGLAFNADLTGLPLGATIVYRAYAYTTDGIAYSTISQNITTPCPAPANLAVSNITTNAALLKWTGTSGATSVIVKVVAAGAGVNGTAQGMLTLGNETATVSGLSALTNYDVYIRMTCTTLSSPWTGPIPFTTLCNPVNLPMTQNFTGTAGTLPSCWTKKDDNTDAITWAIDAMGKAKLSASAINQMNDWLFSGGLNMTAGTSYRIAFTYGALSTTSTEKLALYWGTAADLSTMTNNLFVDNSFNAATTNYDLAFTPTTTGVYYFGWKGFSDGNSGGLYIDNVSIDINPCGLAPASAAVANTTATGTTASWAAVTGSTGYTWKVVASSAGANANAILTGTTAALNATIAGLFPGISYDLFVKANCSANISSAWVGPIPFTTLTQIGLFASAGANDAFVDINWSLPVDNCLLDASSNPYPQGIFVELKDLNNNQIVYQEPIADLSPYIGAQQPTFTQVASGSNSAYYQVPSTAVNSFWVSNLTQWTIESWLKINPSISNATIWAANQGANTPVQLKLNGQVLSLNNVSFSTPVPHSRWTHVALSFTGNVATLYINGDEKESRNISYFNMGNAAYSYNLFQNFNDGQVGEFRLWNRVRTATEIANNRFASTIPNASQATTNLFLHLRWNAANAVPANTGYYAADPMTYSSGNPITLGYTATPNYTPINGTYRHLIGPSQNRTYQLNVRQMGSGLATVNCSTFTATGSTLAFQPPVLVSATDNLLDRVTLTWKNKSKLGEKFNIVRTGVLRDIILGTTVIDSVMTYHDIYDENDSLSIKSGTTYSYCVQTVNNTLNQSYGNVCDNGRSLILSLSASDNTYTDKVVLTWANLATYNYPIRVKRDGITLATLAATATTYTDNNPLFGKLYQYEISLLDSLGLGIMSAFDNGSVPAKGEIKGRVVTQDGGYALKNVRIIARSLVDTTARDTVYTNHKGEFAFANLYYGVFSGKFVLSAKLGNHKFTDNPRTITLSDTSFVASNVLFQDSTGLMVSTTPLAVSNFVTNPNAAQDKVVMNWTYTPTANDSTIWELYREGELLTVLSNAPTSVSTYTDLTGIPQANYIYKLYAYKIQNGTVTKATLLDTTAFPAVTKPTGLTATTNATTGVISLAWANTSTNIQGFNLYKNAVKIAELSSNTLTYTDLNILPGSSNVYSVKAKRKPSTITFESVAETSSAVIAAALPNILTLTATPSAAGNKVTLSWTVPATLSASYNFTGYRIYRKKGTAATEYIGQVFKGRPNIFEDKSGLPSSSYTYMVKPFRKMTNATIAEAAGLSKAALFPVVSAPAALTATNNTIVGAVVMSWTPAYNNLGRNLDGQIVYNGTDTITLPLTTATYRYMTNQTVTTTFGVRSYRVIGGKRYYSNAMTANAKPLAASVNPVIATNFKASQDLPNHIRLSWDYPSYVSSTFKLYRDNVVIATLATTVRTYQDYNAVLGTTHQYHIEATNGSNTSQKVGAWGKLKSIAQLSGLVVTAQKVGMPNVDIVASAPGFYVITRTDSAGYYVIDGLPTASGTTVTVTAEGTNCTFSPATQTFTISAAKVYTMNFVNTFAVPATDTASPATPINVNVLADYARRRVAISWNESNTNYDGIDVYRANTLLGTINAGSNLVLYDTEGYPGISYVYSLRPFIYTAASVKKYGTYGYQTATFPIIEDVLYLTATPKPEENKLTLTWSHRWDNHSYYQVTRNDELMTTIQCGQPLIWDDLTGEPGQQYTYAVKAIMSLNDLLYSSNVLSVTATYPSIGEVKNLTATVPSASVTNSCAVPTQRERNHILLTWESTTQNVNGYRVYRDNNLIATRAKDSLFYRDSEGLPGSLHTYTVRAVLVRNELSYNSIGTSLTSTYPTLSAPSNLSAPIDSAGSIKLAWAYPEDVIDGFFLYYNGSTGTNLPSDTIVIDTIGNGQFGYFHNSGLPGVNYQYAIRAYTKRSGVTFVSPAVTFVCNGGNTVYPAVVPPSNVQATDGVFEHHVVVTWDYPNTANATGLEIYRNGTLLERVPFGLHSYTDVTVVSSSSYSVRAYRTMGGVDYFSANAASNTGYPLAQNSLSASGTRKFGRALSESLDRLLVGAPGDNMSSVGNIIAYRFNPTSKNWENPRSLPNSTGGYGSVLSIYGNSVIAGSPNNSSVWVGSLDAVNGPSGNWINTDGQPFAGQAVANNQNGYMWSDQRTYVQQYVASYSFWFYCFCNLPNYAYNYYPKAGYVNSSYGGIAGGGNTNQTIGAVMDGGSDGLIFTGSPNSGIFQIKQGSWITYNKPANIANNNYGSAMAVSKQHDAIIAAPNFANNGNGVVYIHNDANTTPAATLTCPDNGANNRFGQSVDIEGNFAIVGAPGLNSGKGAAYLYHKKNNAWTYVKRYDYAGTTPDSVGAAVRVGDFAVVGAPNTNAGEGKIYWEDLRLGLLKNVVATNGDYTGKTKISWSFYANANTNVTGFRIYRDGSFILSAGATDTYINDETGIPGKHYIYEVAVTDGTIVSATSSDEGWSKTDGYVEGSVSSLIGSAPIPGVKITATAIIKGDKYTYSAIADNAGFYSFPSLYYSDTTVNYVFTAEYAKHSFVTNPINLLLSPQSHSKSGINFYDKTAYSISGVIHQKDVTTGLDSIKVTAIHQLIDGTKVSKEAYTDKNGKYNLVISPMQTDLAKIMIEIADSRIMASSADPDTLRYHFAPQGPTEFTNFNNFPVAITLDVIDTTRYPVRLSVVTACNNPLTGGKYKIKVQGVNAGYEKTFTTSDQTGELTTMLPPLKYSINVESVDNLNAETQLVVNYLKFRSSALDLYSLDKDTLYKETLAANVDALTHTTFVYHKPPTISIGSGFDRYMCNNSNKPAIIQQGEDYNIELQVQETFNGSACDTRSGYLILSNAGATTQKDTVYFNESTQHFDNYLFTVGNPNLVRPYSHLLNIRYFSNSNNLLGEKNFALIVEGSSQLPGSDVIVDLSENGEVPIPLFVLRDPPGDGSSATIEKGSTTTKTLTFSQEGAAHVYLGSEGKVAFSKVGLAWEVDLNVGGGKGNGRTWEMSATTSQAISTYDDPAPVHIGEQGDVLVGSGLALQYGLIQQLKVSNCDSVKKSTVLGFSPHSIQTQWMYTVGQMRMIVSEYESKIEAVKAGTLTLQKPDGSTYTQDEAVIKLSNLKKNWEQMLVYHKRETLPYYALCDKTGQQKAPEPYNTYANEWRSAFCPLVGSYGADGRFNPTDNIVWDQILVNKYNAANTAIRKYESGELTVQGLWAWRYDANGFADINKYVDEQYNLLHGVQAENITFGSGVNFSKTFESAESKSQSTTINFAMDFSAWLGFVLVESTEVLTGTPVLGTTTEMSAGDVIPIKIGAGFEYTISEEREKATENTNVISYTLADDDEADQFSVTVIQGPATNLGPYFSLLGGRSSCPEEPGTIVRDRPDLRLYDPQTQATTTEQTKSEIPTDAAATFMLQITNMSVFNEARDFKLTMQSKTNPNGAIVTTMGQNLGYGPVILYGMNPDEPFIVPINVQRGLNGYDYEGITIAIEPYCGNTAEATDEAILLDSTTNFSVVMNVHFKNPCSHITLVEPDDNWVISRRNVFDANSREQMMVKFMDYEPYNEMLLGVRMEYRKLGAGAAWQTIPGTIMDRDSLRRWNEENFVASQIPYYPYFWDITDDFARYPDGDYEIRVVAECGVGGQVYSRYAKGKISRQGQLFNNPEPADHIWTVGDEISVSFNRDLDCISIVDSNFVVRSKTQANTFISGKVSCYNNKLLFTPNTPLRYHDGDSLELIVSNVRTDNGYLMDTVHWSFMVIGKDIYVKPDSIKVMIAKGQEVDVNAILAHNSESSSHVNYSFTNVNPYSHWLSSDNVSGSIAAGEEVNASFHIDTKAMLLGTTTASLNMNVNGTMETGALVILVTVLPAAPDWHINPAEYTESMTMLTNFNFDNSNVKSQDTMDVISVWIDNQIRGVAKISKFTSTNYAALVQVYGKSSDVNKELSFRVWDASTGKEYDARPDNSATIVYATNSFVGSVGTPSLLDIFTASDLARYIPLNKGWSWFSVASTNWNKPINQSLASLRHPHTNDVIKTASKTASYLVGTGWLSTNGLDSTNVHRGYQIFLTEADTLRISGATPSIKPIALQNGWNLIGYPLQTETAITNLNFSTTPTSMTLKTVATDQANYSPNMVATYANSAWNYTAESQMSKLRPNFAYQLKVDAATQLLYPGANPLVSPIALRTSPPVDVSDLSTWKVYPADFEHNLLITAVVDYSKTENTNPETKVLAYVGDECRGVGELVYVEELKRYMMQMMVYSNDTEEPISFFIYDGKREKSYDHYENISFSSDSLLGKWEAPYHFSNVAPDDAFTGTVYPNPFSRNLKLNLKSDKVQDFTVQLTDLTGRLIYSTTIASGDNVNVTQTLDTHNLDLTDGVYLLHITGSLGKSLSFKVVYQGN